jgi:hypothetical protein
MVSHQIKENVKLRRNCFLETCFKTTTFYRKFEVVHLSLTILHIVRPSIRIAGINFCLIRIRNKLSALNNLDKVSMYGLLGD